MPLHPWDRSATYSYKLMNTLASLFNLAGPDVLVIFGIMLLLFGAKKLPELARGLGQAVKEFSRAKDDFEREISRPTDTTTPSRQIDHPADDHGSTTAAGTPASANGQTQPVPAAAEPAQRA